MYVLLMAIAFAVCIIALIITLMVGKSETDKAKEFEKAGSSRQQELLRSRNYEKHSLKENLPLLAAIYGIVFLVVIVLLIIYLFNPFN
ncbi:hypothetical protein [Sediminibacillus albus]|uniref:Uncharacterized protein n=1 Tax=Sediminibacillus albus TaxID=407036 RepID=A0A1G8XCE8_9BACI|nr:hypothetical protein [Sediminibacillus albus]SDJ88037.1 hypothetical protein SAMN05216243_1278 [Sediminibacillus albus]